MMAFLQKIKKIASPAIHLVLNLAIILILVKAVLHKSSDPWIFGRFSLFHFSMMVLTVWLLVFINILFYFFRSKFLLILFIIFFIPGSILAVLGITGQVYAFYHPAYKVLFLQPDRVVGWKLVPNFSFPWTGLDWYAREFTIAGRTNSFGFHDKERRLTKPQGTIRVVLFGASMVEALQVNFADTAGQLLERKLNSLSGNSADSRQYEVLNMGVSDFGVGQCLLNWEEYASKFNPDYIFIYIERFNLEETVNKYTISTFPETKGEALWIRPVFSVKDGKLLRHPARDFDKFIKAQNQVIETTFKGSRIIREPTKPILNDISCYKLRLTQMFINIQRRLDKRYTDLDKEIVEINLKVLEELGSQAKKSGCQLIIVDITRFFDPCATKLPVILREFCQENKFGYIPLSDYLQEANKKGRPTQWFWDRHFNKAGNEVFSETMFQWLINNSNSIGRVNGK